MDPVRQAVLNPDIDDVPVFFYHREREVNTNSPVRNNRATLLQRIRPLNRVVGRFADEVTGNLTISIIALQRDVRLEHAPELTPHELAWVGRCRVTIHVNDVDAIIMFGKGRLHAAVQAGDGGRWS